MKNFGRAFRLLHTNYYKAMKTNFDDYNSDRMISNPDNYKWGIVYFNKKDRRVMVPRYNKMMGGTFNFANFYTYLIILGFILVVLISIWLG